MKRTNNKFLQISKIVDWFQLDIGFYLMTITTCIIWKNKIGEEK